MSFGLSTAEHGWDGPVFRLTRADVDLGDAGVLEVLELEVDITPAADDASAVNSATE